MTMLGFLIVALFALAAAVAVAVLTDSSLRGTRAYRELSARVRDGEHYNSVMFKIEQFERPQGEPTFRVRHVTRAAGSRPIVRRKAAALPVAA